MVRERDDHKWSLPGGWADIGYSPREIVVKEIAEETGFTVLPKRLLAVLDKKLHPTLRNWNMPIKYLSNVLLQEAH